MPRRERSRPDHRRSALAAEAARIMQEQGVTDFRSAKSKALERLGLGSGVPLPSNQEIEAELASRQRIFEGPRHATMLAAARAAALRAMEQLAWFEPRLTGDVLSGHATGHGEVELHLFSDTVEAVAEALSSLGLAHRLTSRRHRLRRDQPEQFPGYRFELDGWHFAATVFPTRLRGHAPLSGVDGRPVRRATARELAGLLTLSADQ